MSRRYLVLFVFVALAALSASALARRPHRATTDTARTVTVPRVELALAVESGRIVPRSAAVPKGHLISLRVSNHGATAVDVRLTGYEDRVVVTALAPGATWSGEFVADRPGDDFAWLVDGAPAGRFAVTGSHLLEGHR